MYTYLFEQPQTAKSICDTGAEVCVMDTDLKNLRVKCQSVYALCFSSI